MADKVVTDNPDNAMQQNPEDSELLNLNKGAEDEAANTDEFADPENKKWPLDAEHIKPALSYFNGAKDKDGNDEAKWSSIGHKIAAFATKHYGAKYSYENGKVVKETAKTDGIPLNTCPKCKNSGNTGSFCPSCGASLKAVVDADMPTIVPGNSTNETPCSCVELQVPNRIEKFCTVCGGLVIVIPDYSLTTSVAVPSNMASGNSVSDMGTVDSIEEVTADMVAIGDSIETPVEEYFALEDGEWEVLTDKLEDGILMRVRQLAMVTDSVNKNKRIYPRKVVMDALKETKQRAKMGLVHSDYRHPKVVIRDNKQAFVDEWDRKTAKVEKIEEPDANGRVFITRAILDTPHGRMVANDFKDGKPKGISTRMLMQAHGAALDGETVLVADSMKIPTWDDMGMQDSPAVPDTQKYYTLLTDAVLTELGLETSKASAKETANAVTDKEKKKNMNPEFKAALDAYVLLSVDETPDKEAVTDARKEVAKVMRNLVNKKVEGFDLIEARKALVDADGLFGGGRDQPSIVEAKEISAAVGPAGGYARDIPASAIATQPDQKEDEVVPVKNEDAEADALLVKEFVAERKAAKAAAEAAKAVADHIEAISDAVFGETPEEVKNSILETVKKTAKTIASVDAIVEAMLDNYGKVAAAAKLNAMGMGASEVQIVDPYSGGRTTIVASDRKPALWAEVDQITAAVDAVREKSSMGGKISAQEKAIRAANRPIIEKWCENLLQNKATAKTAGEFVSALDSLDQFSSAPFAMDTVAATDATVLSNFYNQPTVSTALIVQSYQDLTALQYVDPIGPSTGNGDPNWTSIPNGQGMPGWVLRIPSETYVAPTGVGVEAVRPNWGSFYGGLQVADNTGIPEGVVSTVWESFATTPRNIGFSVTRGTSRAAGLGPLNLDIVARHMYHVTYGKNRTLDNAIYSDMLQSSDAYLSVPVTNESVNLTYNSSYNAAGSVIVNLNPRKAASAVPAVATSTTSADPYIQFGANVTAAIRTTGGATPGASGATIYSGTSYGTTPIVKTKITADLNQNGSYSTTTTYPVTVSAPASMIVGYLDGTGQVQSYPSSWLNASPGVATFAVDYETGVLAFSSGLSGSGVLVTTATTVTYSYATNFDNLTPTLAGGNLQSFTLLGANDLSQLAVTLSKETYLSSVLTQIDLTANKMGSASNWMSPNLMISTLNFSGMITPDSTFYKLNSPDGTVLFPADQPSAYFNRNGIMGCRHNGIWDCGDHRALLTRKGSTKYGVGLPAQFNGPYPKYDASSLLIAEDAYYLEEYSTIATPLVQNSAGTIFNAPSRTIIARSPLG
jgi:hypothetical protein